MPTISRIKIWIKMLFGKSDLHRPQPVGKYFKIHEIKGYYNDLTSKVLFDKKHIDAIDYIPTFKNDYGNIVKFPISIIQYALGCIDMYFETNDKKFIKKAITCADYIYEQVEADGSISCMFFVKGLKNYNSSMCQGEAISLFSRLALLTNNKKYFDICDKLFDFLVDSADINSVCKLGKKGLLFYEYPDKELVLNGYLFSLFGVYDYFLLKNDLKIKEIFDKSVEEISLVVNEFVCGKWSYYDLNKNISSKFYHSLHISLLESLSKISNKDFSKVINLFQDGLKSRTTRIKMFWKKAFQKLRG